jgi:hypothetical protein
MQLKLAAFLLCLAASASATAWSLPEYALNGATNAKDLEFPTAVSDIKSESTARL